MQNNCESLASTTALSIVKRVGIDSQAAERAKALDRAVALGCSNVVTNCMKSNDIWDSPNTWGQLAPVQSVTQPGRPRRRPEFIAGTWLNQVRESFLYYGYQYDPTAFWQLKNGRLSPDQNSTFTVERWARKYHIAVPWVMEWANSARSYWLAGGRAVGPIPPEVLQMTKCKRPGAGQYYRITFSTLPVGGDAQWKTFKRLAHQALESEMDAYRDRMVSAGACIRIPSDLDVKLRATALYYLCNMKPEEIGNQPPFCRERTVINRWIREIASILPLPGKPPGRPKR